MKKKVVVICGPTGIGKTAFAIKLARLFSGQIINADSMQIYKFMDIGTAKPDEHEQRQARHHMIDIVEPDEEFDAGKFAMMSHQIISQLHSEDILPIVAGGTGFYIKSLLYGLFRNKTVDSTFLAELERELEKKGASHLHQRLAGLDPVAAGKIHPNDGFRIIRAIEIYQSTGRPISEHQQKHQFKNTKYDALIFGLSMDRDQLYHRINQRVDQMMDEGLVQEVQSLYRMGYSPDLKSMQSIGYKHAGMYLNNEVDLDRCIELLKRDTRRYAKRQFTWFKHQETCHWIPRDDVDTAARMVKDFLT